MNFLEIIGYTASVLVAISLSLTSVVKFRIINFCGAFLFSLYGFFINAIPVGILNGFIAIVDLYYLHKIFSKKENFEILKVSHNNEYLKSFVTFYKSDITKFYPDFNTNTINENNTIYFILRNIKVSGLLICRQENNKLKILIDYVIPEYRDYKNAKYLYDWLEKEWKSKNIEYFEASPQTKEESQYFQKIKFNKTDNSFIRKIS
ncbi:MAG: hypothetical protein N3A01_03215 [Bacteroidales bacterium]|nr:hypothetical protein [Bacteroidales bacterium]